MGQVIGTIGTSGNLFKDKEWQEVSSCASVLLSNRAESRLQLGDLSGAVVDAAVSIVLDSNYKKAAFKLVKAYARWQEARPCADNKYRLTANALASFFSRRWPSLRRTSLFRSLQCDLQSDPHDLWWEEHDFIEILHPTTSSLSVSVPCAGAWRDMKSEANKNFNSKRFELARDGYSRAL